MANTIQLKRRASGNAGAPAALKSGEMVHNEVDDTLYSGKGDDGAGNATTMTPLAGRGAFVELASAHTVRRQINWDIRFAEHWRFWFSCMIDYAACF